MRRRHARMPDCFVMTFITPHSGAARAHFSSPSDFMIYLMLEGAARVPDEWRRVSKLHTVSVLFYLAGQKLTNIH